MAENCSSAKERQREGIERAKKEGRYTGRPRKITDEQWEQIKAEIQAGARKTDIAQKYGVSREGIYNMLARERREQAASNS